MTWADVVHFLEVSRLGDLTGIAGFVVTIVGFIVTFRAARQARDAAEKARDSLFNFETVVDFSSAIAILEEIKRAQRSSQWVTLPDRYASIRKLLITMQSSAQLDDDHREIVQAALVNIRGIESSVERHLQTGTGELKAARFNALLSEDIDRLVSLLTTLKARGVKV